MYIEFILNISSTGLILEQSVISKHHPPAPVQSLCWEDYFPPACRVKNDPVNGHVKGAISVLTLAVYLILNNVFKETKPETKYF